MSLAILGLGWQLYDFYAGIKINALANPETNASASENGQRNNQHVSPQNAQANNSQNNPNLPDIGFEKLISINVFGELINDTPKVEIKAELEEITYPETRLKLVLKGTITANVTAQASALIEDEERKTRHYQVDSPLPGNAHLVAVYKDRVVLKRDQQFETLYFEKSAGAAELANNQNSEFGLPVSASTKTSAVVRRQRPSSQPRQTEPTANQPSNMSDRQKLLKQAAEARRKRIEQLRALRSKQTQ